MHILAVEDERAFCETIVRNPRRLAYSVDLCSGGDEALPLLKSECFDLTVLDLNLPGMDGMTVLRMLHTHDRDTRILALPAWSEVSDKVAGLDAGANDCLARLLHLAELEARIRSLTLRQFTQWGVLLCFGKLSLDTKARCVSADGQLFSLTKKRLGALEYLLLRQGCPVSQEELLDHVWNSNADCFSNSIRVHISMSRKKPRAALGYDPVTNRISESYVLTETVE